MYPYVFETKNHIISCPTAEHLSYLQYISYVCQIHGINLLLKGSISTGKATKFSDIDIVIIENRDDVIEEIISGYQRIIMSAKTERPKGILILVYKNGLCIDLDVRKSITSEELNRSVLLNCENINDYVKSDIMRYEDIYIPSVPEREDWYKLLRLFHRSLIKRLSLKITEAESILQEIKNEIEKDFNVSWRGRYIDDIKIALGCLWEDHTVPEEFNRLIYKLINEALKRENFYN